MDFSKRFCSSVTAEWIHFSIPCHLFSLLVHDVVNNIHCMLAFARYAHVGVYKL